MSNLKLLTKMKYDEVKAHPFYQKILDGNVTDKRYALYLWEQRGRYEAIEDWLEGLGVIDDMPELLRYNKVRDDFEELWVEQMGNKFMPQPSFSTTEMQKRLKELVEDDINDNMQGLAHVYAMHGDLLELSKVIDLDKIPGSNTMFQWSEDVDALIKELDAKLTDEMAEEVIYSYDLKIRMFNYLMSIDIPRIVHGNLPNEEDDEIEKHTPDDIVGADD